MAYYDIGTEFKLSQIKKAANEGQGMPITDSFFPEEFLKTQPQPAQGQPKTPAPPATPAAPSTPAAPQGQGHPATPQTPPQQHAPAQADPSKLAMNVLVRQGNSEEFLVVITFPQYQRETTGLITSFIKTAPNRPRWKYNNEAVYTQTGHEWVLESPTVAFLKALEQVATRNGHDISQLENAILEVSQNNPQAASDAQQRQTSNELGGEGDKPHRKIGVHNVYAQTNYVFHVALVPFRKEDSALITEFLKFSFPMFVGDNVNLNDQVIRDQLLRDNPKAAMRRINKNAAYVTTGYNGYKPWTFEIRGNFADYAQIEDILAKHGFDTTELRDICRNLYLKDHAIELGKIQGDLDGYKKDDPKRAGRKTNDVDAFYKEIDRKYGPQGVHLWGPQKDGVRFLYSRQGAILGDDTGAGKTYQMIAAADLRMQQSGGRCIIITLNTVKQQWADQIAKITGEDGTISNDPASGHKWTILSYNQFGEAHKVKTDPQNPDLRKRDVLVNKIINQPNAFSVLILDECHNVKNDSLQTDNISKIADVIPYKWGASATMIANKPIDAYNQLRIIGHRLGQISEGNFRKHFGGDVETTVKMRGGRTKRVLETGNDLEQKKAAQQLRKWLTLSGCYLRRSKKDINPDLPNNIVTSARIDIDLDAFNQQVSRIMENYKNPDLIVSQMQAARRALAIAKVPYTLDMARSALMKGITTDPQTGEERPAKIVVFTCFNDAAKMLTDGINKILADIGDGGTAVQYKGGMSQDTRGNYVQMFLDKEGPIKAMIISILAGGTGLDLPNVVDTVIMNDFSWTPKDADQAEGRAFRINSKFDVHQQYMVAKDSPDEQFYVYVQRKKELAATIQRLTSIEAKMISEGKVPADVQKDIDQLQRQDQTLDQDLIAYIKDFIASLKGGAPAHVQNIEAAIGWYNRVKKIASDEGGEPDIDSTSLV